MESEKRERREIEIREKGREREARQKSERGHRFAKYSYIRYYFKIIAMYHKGNGYIYTNR